MTSHRGLTIVEMLVVTAIIVLLVAITFAILSPVRERGRETACTSNLHQIGLAYRIYTADYDGVEPAKGVRLRYYEVGLPSDEHLENFFRNYVKNAAVLRCPSYHGSIPSSRMMCTYAGISVDSEQWADLEAMRGPELPIDWCAWHNPVADPMNGYLLAPRWEQKRMNILRLGGQVKFVIRPARDFDSWAW